MTCLIIDDNPIARTTLSHLASQVSDLVVICEYCTAVEAYDHLQSQHVDLLFLDIEMPMMSGLDLTKNLLKKETLIIFTSSKVEYAAEAFELNVVDYLLKPITVCRFLQSVSRARDILESRKSGQRLPGPEHMFIRDSGIIRKLNFEDIAYAEAMGDYVKFHTSKQTFTIHGTMKMAEEKLPADMFVRIHRSYIIAFDKVDSIQDGGLIIVGKFLPIADAYKRQINSLLNIF